MPCYVTILSANDKQQILLFAIYEICIIPYHSILYRSSFFVFVA